MLLDFMLGHSVEGFLEHFAYSLFDHVGVRLEIEFGGCTKSQASHEFFELRVGGIIPKLLSLVQAKLNVLHVDRAVEDFKVEPAVSNGHDVLS